jgi:hypothetical protein
MRSQQKVRTTTRINMKKLLVLTSILALSGAVLGQGTVNFQTLIPGSVDARVLKVDGAPAGAGYWAQLFAGETIDSLTAVDNPVAFAAESGYVVAGGKTITTIPAGAAAFVQLRAWAAASGSSWDDASANPAGIIGQSSTLSLSATGNPTSQPPGTPVNLVGLEGFQLALVPEPSTWLLLALGLGALALRRRK